MNPVIVPPRSTAPAGGRRPLFVFLAMHLGLALGICLLHWSQGPSISSIAQAPAQTRPDVPPECGRNLPPESGSGCCLTPSGPNGFRGHGGLATPKEAS